ncbi:MAG TPA: LuxR C-terminal-related transcriptional regulator [Candidatus Eisenbacteria bacterium]|nr:LuxR C-terminal-related transcriptional regulator [Candidatus Eisenbacteria bacterium]
MTVPLRVPAGTGPGSHPEAPPADPPDAILGPAMAALAMGDYRGAANMLDEVVSAKPDLARAHEMLGGIALGVLDDYPRAFRHLEISYRLHREVGDFAAAARASIALAQVEVAGGNGAGARGWLGRAKRLIDEIGPCVEEGYYRIAMMGCEVPDVIELEASSSRALEVARTFRDTNLEVRALADSGLALISLGRTADGLKRLDEALTAVISGEVRDLVTCGFTCCAVVSACSLLGDIDRLTRLIENLRRVASERFNGFQPPILTSHCHQTYGGMLSEAGRWEEAEAELRRAVEVSVGAGHRAAAMAGLAELRIHQNRTSEAAVLLRGWEDRLETAPAQARLHDARDELDVAASTLRWALREQATNVVASAALLAHLVDVECRRGAEYVSVADDVARRLEAIADSLASPGIRAMARLSRGRVQTARGEDASATLQAALRDLGNDERPRLRAEVHLALAEAERERDVAAATTQARAALAIFERLGARRDADRAAVLLRSVGVSVRARADTTNRNAPGALSRREREVVPLIAEGLSNAEIAKRLFVTPKTIEHHVTSILGRLDLRTRTEIAAWAHRTAVKI